MELVGQAFDYDRFGHGYAGYRQTDPHILSYVLKALGDANTVMNVGAGAGSYEPEDRYVIAIEPSATMRSQREARGKAPAVAAFANELPFDNCSFDASTAFLTVHHWPDITKGLIELRRVTKKRVLVMTFDPEALNDFWNAAYFPDVIEVEKKRYPSIDSIKAVLGGICEVQQIQVPFDCKDGFQEAFYGRPEAFLDSRVRQSQSAWGFISEEVEEKYVQKLAEDLKSGEWDRKYGHFRFQATFAGALRMIVATLT